MVVLEVLEKAVHTRSSGAHTAQTGSSNEHFTVNLHREVYLPGLSVVFEFTPPTWRLALRQ